MILKMTNVIIFCIFYDDNTKAYIEKNYGHLKWLYPVKNPHCDKYLESGFMATWLHDNKHLWQDKDFVGCLSWKFDTKMPVPDLDNLSTDLDFVGFLYQPYTLFAGARDHPQFEYLFTNILKTMGYGEEEIASPKIPGFYCNYFLCKPMWMELYLVFLRRAIGIMDTKPDIQEALFSDAKYQNDNKYNEERLMALFGKKYYTHHCFVLERLPSFFFWRHGAKMGVWKP